MTFVDITPLQEDLVDSTHQIQFQYKGSHLHILVEFPASSPSSEIKQRVEQALLRCQLPGIRHVLIYGRPIQTEAIEWRLGFQVRLGPTSSTEGRIRSLIAPPPAQHPQEVPTEIKILELPSSSAQSYRFTPSTPEPDPPRTRRRRRRRRSSPHWLRFLLSPSPAVALSHLLIGGVVCVVLALASWKGLELMEEYSDNAREAVGNME